MANQATWTGTATDLLELLGRIVGEKATKAKTWPVDAARLSGKLRRAATFLREVGIEISVGERGGRGRTRTITITSVSEPHEEGNSASTASATKPHPHADGNGRRADARAEAGVRANPLENNDETAADATDAKSHTLQGSEKTASSCLSDGHIRQLAGDYLDAAAMELEETGDVDRAALEHRLREKLATTGVPPEAIAAEFARVMEVLTAF